jgi:transmembrane sensor
MEKQPEEFGAYLVEDFLDHPGFTAWVLAPDEHSDRYWENVRQRYPEKTPLIAEAIQMVLSLRFEAEFLAAREQEELWQLIDEKLGDNKTARRLPVWLYSAAAVLVVGLCLGLAILFLHRRVSYSTGYGELRTVMLPDSSLVILNANSRIQYAADWNRDKPREIWLTGEAYFQVRHLYDSGAIRPGERFIAHAGKANIEVLGTSFNLSNRHGRTDADLIEGQIRFEVPEKQGVVVTLQPGDRVQYLEAQDTILKKKGNPKDFSGWKSGELHFDRTPAGEIFRYFEDTYGCQVVVKDSSILKKTLSGTFKSNNRKVLLRTISAAWGITMELSPDAKKLLVHY